MRDVSEEILSLFVAIRLQGSSTKPCPNEKPIKGTTALTLGLKELVEDITEEDLSYLRDIAEREAINRFTTAEIHVDMSGMTNKIESDIDIDGIFDQLGEKFSEALSVSCEGVHL